MYTGSLGAFTNRENWDIISPLIDDDGSEVTLTDAEIYFYVTRPDSQDSALITATTDPDNGKITLPSTTTFLISLTRDDVKNLCAGTYHAFLRVIIDGKETSIVVGEIQVIHGGPA